MLKIIQNNPYRFLGVCSNASIKDRVANGNRLKAFLKVGKDVSFPLDLSDLIPSLSRTAEGLETANNSINLPKDQLKYALFWFINASSIDKMALEYLQKGNTVKAIELFGKREDFSSLINRGVMAFINGNEGEAIQCITKVIHNDDFRKTLVETVCGVTFTIQEDELAQLFIDALLEEVSVVRLKDLFSQFGASSDDNDVLKEKAVGQYVDAINSAIADANTANKDNASAQLQAGTKLMNSTKKDLQAVKSTLGDRSKHNNVSEAGEVNEFLSQLNNCGEDGVLVIGATNKPMELDEAALRAGRLEFKYYIPQPDAETRASIFEINLSKRKCDFGIDYDKLASLTENYISADIKMIVDNAARLTFRRKLGKITQQVLEEVIADSKPTISIDVIRKHEAIRDEFMGVKKEQTPKKIGFN